MIHEVLTPKDRFEPLGANHPGLGIPCPECGEPLLAGDRPSLVNGSPASPEDEAKAERGGAHNLITVIAHQRCAYPEGDTMNLKDYIIYDEPDDHRLMLVGGRLYIFDRSGDTPLDTDDGPLEILDRYVWVDSDGLSVEAYRPGSDEPRTVRISTSLARQMVDSESFTLSMAPRTP